MAVLSSFCGILTLQVGAAILSIVFFTLAGVIMAANIFDYHNSSEDWPLSLLLMIILVVSFIVIGVFMFLSAYSEVRRWAIIAVIGLVILSCYWIILSCFSFFGTWDHVTAICIETRCPESFWIANLDYRRKSSRNGTSSLDNSKLSSETSPSPLSTPSPSTTDITTTELQRRRRYDFSYLQTGYEIPVYEDVSTSEPKHHKTWKRQNHRDYIGHLRNGYGAPISVYVRPKRHDETYNATKGDDDELSGIVHGFPFSGAVVLFFANLLFLIYTTLIMWSWASEIEWAEYYVEEEPVIVY